MRSAELEVRAVTILIGPQASGKSILCKLVYFLLNVVHEQARYIGELEPLDSFKKDVKERFAKWFPVGTWGPEKFEVSLTAGEYEIRFMRTEYKGKLGERFRLYLSDAFTKNYERALEAAKRFAKTRGVEQLEFRGLQIFDQIESMNGRLLGSDYFENQIFVPAARSFFTSMGRAVSAFEQGGNLDPLTILFGRFFTARLERRSPVIKLKSIYLTRAIAELLGGELVRKNDQSYVLSKDGRRVPLQALSSGQQEVLPLLTTIPYLSGKVKRLIYIEEPEAHLFPSAQGSLVELLAAIIKLNDELPKLIITTHSPYVLAKFNNLIKAGSLVNQRAAAAKIIPEESWVEPHTLAAYAITDGKLLSITDEEGLIDAEYLDDVSSKIGKEFDDLLELEVGNAS